MNTRDFCRLCCIGHPANAAPLERSSSDAGALSDDARKTLHSLGATVVAVGFGGFLGLMVGGKKSWALGGAGAGYVLLSLARMNAELSRPEGPPAA